MCYTCGCNKPYDDMGSKDNLTEADFKKAGKTKAIGKGGTLTAKKNMIALLQREVKQNELEKPQRQY